MDERAERALSSWPARFHRSSREALAGCCARCWRKWSIRASVMACRCSSGVAPKRSGRRSQPCSVAYCAQPWIRVPKLIWAELAVGPLKRRSSAHFSGHFQMLSTFEGLSSTTFWAALAGAWPAVLLFPGAVWAPALLPASSPSTKAHSLGSVCGTFSFDRTARAVAASSAVASSPVAIASARRARATATIPGIVAVLPAMALQRAAASASVSEPTPENTDFASVEPMMPLPCRNSAKNRDGCVSSDHTALSVVVSVARVRAT